MSVSSRNYFLNGQCSWTGNQKLLFSGTKSRSLRNKGNKKLSHSSRFHFVWGYLDLWITVENLIIASSGQTVVISRPSLRRPKVAIVEAVEAEAKAAKGLVIPTCSSSSTSATKVSSHQVAASSTTSLAQREEAEGAENEPASTAAAAATEKIPHQSKAYFGSNCFNPHPSEPKGD